MLILVILWGYSLIGGFPALGSMSLNVRSLFFFQVLTLIGFILLWFHEVAGAYLALGAMVLFLVINLFTKQAFPMGGVIFLFFLPSIMALISHHLLLKD